MNRNLFSIAAAAVLMMGGVGVTAAELGACARLRAVEKIAEAKRCLR